MNTRFLDQYNEEYRKLQRSAQEFKRKHPRVANHINMGDSTTTDPMVNQLVQSFSFVSADIKQAMQQQYPRIAQSCLNILYPQLTKPFPACTVMSLAPNAQLNQQHLIEKDTEVAVSHNDITFRARTTRPLALQPLELQSIQFNDERHNPKTEYSSTLTLGMNFFQNVSLEHYTLKPVDFYINEDYQLSLMLYGLLLQDSVCIDILNQDGEKVQTINKTAIEPLGLDANSRLLPGKGNSINGYELLNEYIHFPQQFLFFRINFPEFTASQCGNQWTIHIRFSSCPTALLHQLTNDSLTLHSTPVVNLFSQVAEPIILDNHQTEYPVVPDNYVDPENLGLYSVERVQFKDSSNTTQDIHPFYGLHHSTNSQAIYWHTHRKPSVDHGFANVIGHEALISFVNSQGSQAHYRHQPVLNIDLLCTNRNALHTIPIETDSQWFFWNTDYGNVAKPTPLQPFSRTVYPDLHSSSMWRLLSHLSAQKQSYANLDDCLSLLKEYFALYQLNPSIDCQSLLDCAQTMTSRPISCRHPLDPRGGFIQGTEITLLCESEQHDIDHWFLIGSVLHRIFSETCAINSFVTLKIESSCHNKVLNFDALLGKQSLV